MDNFNTEKVETMYQMFKECTSLSILDLSSFNTLNVTNMEWMFNACHDLKTIYVSNKWTTVNVTKGDSMFGGCTSLVGGAGTPYDANHTNNTYAHIDGGTANPGYLTLKLSMGDANGDGYVNIADAVATVTNILGVPTAEDFYQYAADMNTDQVIDIFDVTLIVNAAFDAASPAPAMTRGSAGNVMMENVSITADAENIYLGIDQPERFTAMQFDVTLPEGVELANVRLTSATTDHQVSFVKRGENEYRVIGLSLSNATFRSLDGQLLKLQTSGSAVDSNVKMSNVLFVKPSGKTVTGIEAVNSSMSNVQRGTWYNLKGQRVSKQQLGKGIYIMNHKKVVIE
jgi:surface protein